jgi:hypothetical protein
MDPDSKPKGQRTKKRRDLPTERGRWEISGSNGCLWDASLLLDKGGGLDGERSCDGGNVLTWYKVERSGLEHGAGKVAHEGTSLEMEVAKHYIRTPTVNELNDTGIDAAAQQGLANDTSPTRAYPLLIYLSYLEL